MEVLGYCLTVLCPRGAKRCGQIILSPYLYPDTVQGERVATQRGGGLLRSEYQAAYRRSTRPNRSIYQSGFANKLFGLDALNNLRKSIRPFKNISVLNYEFNLRPVFASLSTFTIQHTGQFLNPLSVLWRNELSKESQRDVVLVAGSQLMSTAVHMEHI
jgi:hypothetical protein